MSWLYALILGLVQGLTEFFPISSSAHLEIAKRLLGIHAQNEPALFDLSCHLGTVLALIVYFRKEIPAMFKKIAIYFWALVPLIPAYFLLKPIRLYLSQPQFLGWCLLITAALLFITTKLSKGLREFPRTKDALWIGVFQSFALIPGISRSASTITAGLWRGLKQPQAVCFSFLLSIPAVLGGLFLESIKVPSGAPLDLLPCLIGFMASALSGFAVIGFAIPLLQKKSLKPFAWYCLIVAILLGISAAW